MIVSTDRLINEAVASLGEEAIYNAALPYVDFKALQAAQPVSTTDLSATFAVAGFAAGIKFSSENASINEAVASLGIEAIYNAALPYVDFETLQAAQPVSTTDLSRTFAVAGFAAGIKFSSENVYISDDEKGESDK